VFILGSGNVVHNLSAYAWGRRPVEPFAWAVRFETQVRERLRRGEIAALVEYDTLGRDARLSIPTPDHYLPLLYVMALQREDEPIHFPVAGIEDGSVSMLAVQVG
jgi:4,5-DOPA dioxygenase extradiol